VLDGDAAVVFCEAKWRSGQAMNQGVSGTKSQLQLRRDFLGVIGPRVYGERGFVVCGVVLDDPLAVEPPDANEVHTASVTWEQLAGYDRHPRGDEFSRYLSWKRSFLPARTRPRSSRKAPTVMGVDGYRKGWIAVEIRGDGVVATRTAARFEELLDSNADVIAVDIPIGLDGRSERAVDAAARRAVGARRSSVFTTPPREVLEAASYAEANQRSRELTGKGVSRQSFDLRHRILEVDLIAHDDDRVIEVHPEVSFSELAGAPLGHSKHTPEGLAERRKLLATTGVRPPDPPSGVPEADLLDATVAAWTAKRFARGAARPLPAGHHKRIGAIWV
jgi:predicted RNase H-like nuclease